MTEGVRKLVIDGQVVADDSPTYFIADVAANHDGDIARAIELIHLAKDAGASAVKFQHFKAESIVSDFGFKSLGGQFSHQAKWKKSVYEVYRDASVDIGWTPKLKSVCDEVGITFFTSPYSFDLVDQVDPFVPAYKIGSGDITWLEMIECIASKGKPYIIATGASSMDDVVRAMDAALKINNQAAIMQCNTNYTGSLENFKHIQLRVLNCYKEMFPGVVLGLSDHTPGFSTVLGAVALGARMIEKHFTDDCSRVGPDHGFSLNPTEWRDMVDRTRELELALGTGLKRVEDNERQTAVLQRRGIRASRDLPVGAIISKTDIEYLRPCPPDALPPYQAAELIGRRLRSGKEKGEHFRFDDIE